MAFALYLLKANNKLSLFMPCHAHLTLDVCFCWLLSAWQANLKTDNKLIPGPLASCVLGK